MTGNKATSILLIENVLADNYCCNLHALRTWIRKAKLEATLTI